MNVALTFNVKPESETFHENLFAKSKLTTEGAETQSDTFAEWDTWETINAVKDALECFHNVELIEADDSAYEKLKQLKPDIVFNIAEGFNGASREAQIPSILDMLQIPYTGSDPLTLTTCLDKARTKEILSYYKIPNAKFVIADNLNHTALGNLQFPLIVKPVQEGSSKGIFSSSLVNNSAEANEQIKKILNEYGQPALIEEFLPGREFTAAILGNGEEAKVLPLVEIKFNQFPEDFIPIYSYEAKWILDTKENPLDVFECPARLTAELEEEIMHTALKAYKILRCRDWSRIDIRLDSNGAANIIEINPLPGILPNAEDNSCYPKAARTSGLSYSDMINNVLYFAAKRHKLI